MDTGFVPLTRLLWFRQLSAGERLKKKLILKKEKSDGDNETKEISSLSCSH